jgi:hypothetical protein
MDSDDLREHRRTRIDRAHRAAIVESKVRKEREQAARDRAWAARRAELRPVTLLPLGDLAVQLETDTVQAEEAAWRRRLGRPAT